MDYIFTIIIIIFIFIIIIIIIIIIVVFTSLFCWLDSLYFSFTQFFSPSFVSIIIIIIILHGIMINFFVLNIASSGSWQSF